MVDPNGNTIACDYDELNCQTDAHYQNLGCGIERKHIFLNNNDCRDFEIDYPSLLRKGL